MTRAYAEAGVLGVGEAMRPNLGAPGLDILNGMLDSWTIDGRYIYCQRYDTYTLVSGTQEYALGPGATWDTGALVPRPKAIIAANLILPGATNPLNLYVANLDKNERMQVGIPTLPGQPAGLNYKADFPNGSVWIWPVPNQSGYTIQLQTDKLLVEFADTGTPYAFPPGYYEAIVYSLAERYCTPAFGRDSVPEGLANLAMLARVKIESVNLTPPPQMTCDPRAFGARQGNGVPVRTVYNNIDSGLWLYY